MKELTINWHITQKCNYKCHYCFAHYDKCDKRELHYNKHNITHLLSKVYEAFTRAYKGHTLRLNLAGGEPLSSKNIGFIIKQAHSLGFKVSIITNASLLNTKWISTNASYLSVLGVSVDSIDKTTNQHIGRIIHRMNKPLSIGETLKHFDLVRIYNPHIRIKINTVVSAYNYKEYLGHFIALLKPDKWKIFQALSINTKHIFCTKEQFEAFLHTHKDFTSIITQESNDAMTDSYIMLDPYGRFYQNSKGRYEYSPSLLDLSSDEIIGHIAVDMRKYHHRYLH